MKTASVSRIAIVGIVLATLAALVVFGGRTQSRLSPSVVWNDPAV